MGKSNASHKLGYACFILLTVLSSTGFAPVQQRPSRTLIHFKHWVGKKPLQLFDETYTNSFGEPFVVSKFKYYISGIVVTGADGQQNSFTANYYLVNEEDSVSKTIALPVTGPIQRISFTIGVDSARNVGGVQTGSLDPVNAMFWTWNSGYVFAKLEGQSDVSTAPAHSFSWHVGGFRQKENALRKIALIIDHPTVENTLTINADILPWFNAVHPMKIAETAICHQPGNIAVQLADNYSTMFYVAL
jgi:hypothetical protein